MLRTSSGRAARPGALPAHPFQAILLRAPWRPAPSVVLPTQQLEGGPAGPQARRHQFSAAAASGLALGRLLAFAALLARRSPRLPSSLVGRCGRCTCQTAPTQAQRPPLMPELRGTRPAGRAMVAAATMGRQEGQGDPPPPNLRLQEHVFP